MATLFCRVDSLAGLAAFAMPLIKHLRLSAFICGSLLFLQAIPAAQANPPALPEPVLREQPGFALAGSGTLRYFGFRVYDIRLWAPGGKYAAGQPFALELVYAMDFKGADIAQRSVDEIRGQGVASDEQLARWGAEMARMFPDIKAGESLIGVARPGKEARFYSRERFIATLADPEFATAFFGIWLAEKTSQPSLRKRLLGQS